MAIGFRNGTVGRGGALPDVDRLLVTGETVAPWNEQAEPDQIVDLGGGYLGPAFGDGHAHPILAGLEAQGPQVRGANSVAEVVDLVARWARAHPDDAWIVGGSYDASMVKDGLFDARWLDEAVLDRPIVLHAWDYHSVWCNSRALELAGIGADTPEPELGRIPRRADATVLGTLFEWGAVDLVMRCAPPVTTGAGVEALRYATAHLASYGITWIQDAWVDPPDIDLWLAADRAGALACRADLALRADPVRWEQQRVELTRQRALIEESPSLTCRTVKFFVDGILENHTAHLLENYADSCCRGMPVWQRDDLLAAAAYVDSLGFELHMHAIGDAGARWALDAVEHLVEVNGPRDRRPVIAHAQLVHGDDLHRFAELGVIACFQPLWAACDDVMQLLTLPRLGDHRGGQQYRIRTLLDSGAAISYGSDWPVTSADVLRGLRTAVTRQDEDGLPETGWIPAERISISDALTMSTAGVAYQARTEQHRGTLADGSDADLVWLSADPRTVPADELTAITVLGTWKAGRRTYSPLPTSQETPNV
ncbi:amidohydrolase [Rhodococcus fascians]|nr:amidohydrolase [Rhodococcus fascians]MBY4140895.1 amidohydrolase [Rhodococcus fascians]MBY4219559.1 amidohydrolase [Rhodococcus fascians]MBY4221868.1 amidohydrolase [Rhodococcus fascians]MBY4233869.1 amidohydrolase [Rhodococcus fascians]